MDDAVRIALAVQPNTAGAAFEHRSVQGWRDHRWPETEPDLFHLIDTIPIFSPQTIRLSTQIYSEALSYTVERGGKREKRVAVAKDTTDVDRKDRGR